MNELLQWLKDARTWVLALAVLLGAFLISRIVAAQIRRAPFHAQQRLMFTRMSTAIIFGIAVATALGVLGIELGVLLGAAGVATVALGFAAQTSVSNLISGAFLMVEQPFVVGDVIEVNGITGEVLSVDAISVRMRTFDNILVRIPNETMLKANVRNMTHFPIRRVDMKLAIAYRDPLPRVRELLLAVADRNTFALRDPAPLVIYTAFGDSGIDIQYSVWGAREQFLALRNSLYEDIQRTFAAEGIEIPFPQRVIHAVSAGAPVPAREPAGPE